MSYRNSHTKGHDQKKNNTKASSKPGKGSSDDDFAFQLVHGNGSFNTDGLEDFARKVNLQQCDSLYAVIAIMGPQSSGKSTLLNHLFGTNFKEMNHDNGRSQTTKGIWLARSPDIKPLTLVMDMEGTDGSERGQEETAFEKQSAFFALSVADVVLINMWCQDIGRENAANKPLLRVVFQQVMIQFCNKPRKMTLMFVVRDKTKSPENVLEAKLKEDIRKLWDSVLTPTRSSSNLQLHNFFQVEVVFLPNYEEQEEEFKVKVKELKQRFIHSTAPGGLADKGEQKKPASGFPMMAQNIWEHVLENKDLDTPSHKVMVAMVRCEDIKNELCDSFQVNEDWCRLRKDALFGFVPDFGKIMNSVFSTYVSKYDEEAICFDEEVTNEKRQELLHQMSQLVEPVYQSMVIRLRLEYLMKFMEEFNKDSDKQNSSSVVADRIQYYLREFDQACAAIRVDGAKWDTLKAKAKLRSAMNSYSHTKYEDKLAAKIRRLYEPNLKQELSESVRYLLCEETDPTWSKIRERFKTVIKSTLSQFDHALSEFRVDEENKKERIESLEKYAKLLVESKAREESGRVKIHMISKFDRHLRNGYNSWLSDLKNNEEIDKAANGAVSTPLRLLASLAAIRLKDDESDDNIEGILFYALLGSGDKKQLKGLDSTDWEKVPSSRTLITPIQCKEVWEAFKVEAKDAVKNAHELVQPELEESNHLKQEYVNKFLEAFHKHSEERNPSVYKFKDQCYTSMVHIGNRGERDIAGTADCRPAPSIYALVKPNSPVSTCPETKMAAPNLKMMSIPSAAPDKSSVQNIKVEDRGGIEKISKRVDKGKKKVTTPVRHVEKSNAGQASKAGADESFLPSSPAFKLTMGSKSLPTNPHSFGYPFNTFSSSIDGTLESDPNRSFWNQAVNFGDMIDRTLMLPVDVEHHKMLTPAQRGHFIETTILQLISMIRIQNQEFANLFNCPSKIETSGKVKSEKETKIDRPGDKLEEVLPYKKVGSVQKLKNYLDVLEFGFWNGVKQVAHQAMLRFPGFEIDETKLDMFKGLHNGQFMDPREVPEETVDVELT